MSDFVSSMDAFVNDLYGEDYKTVLGRLHNLLKPASYLEIGSRDGSSLALTSCPSIAIDPMFQLTPSFFGNKPFCCLYRMGSDQFFSDFNPEAILGRKVDFAFLDGLHLAEFLLRDFINVERVCRPNSVIAIHDCLPLDAAMARRHEYGQDGIRSPRFPDWWTGDVWKVLVALRKYRPALQIKILDAKPTGLALITGLDPQSSVLSQNYYDIVNEFQAMSDADAKAFVDTADIVATTTLTTYEDVSRFFWL